MVTFLNQSRISKDVDAAVIGTISEKDFSEVFPEGAYIIPSGTEMLQRIEEVISASVEPRVVEVLALVAEVLKNTRVVVIFN